MKITFDRLTLLKKLLNPIGKITEGCVLIVRPKEVYTVATSPDGGIILYAQLVCDNDEIKSETVLNIPNVRKLIQVLECIEDPFVELRLESNHLAYSSPTIKFKYFLLDDGIIEKPPIKVEKINSLRFDCVFELPQKEFSDLIKGSSFTTDTNKVYFYTKDKQVFAELTDQTLQNTDSLTFKVAHKFKGTDLKQVLPLNMDVMRLIYGSKAESITVNINTENKVLMFEHSSSEHITKYIVSSLVK